MAEAETKVASVTNEQPCGNCGEMVRSGLVRCWNCSAFLRPEIEEAYKVMRQSPQPVIYSELPEIDEPDQNAATDQNDDSDFELNTGYRLQPAPQPDQTPPPAADQATDTPPPPPSDETPPPPPADSEQPAAARNDTAEDGVPHSIATGGDALLDIALSEQEDDKKRKRNRKRRRLSGPRSATGVMIFCPNGHRIEVEERHRGRTGRCPKCRVPFFVPAAEKKAEDGEAGGEAAEAAAVASYGKYTHWMNDVHVHSVNPEKLKLKPGSLKLDFQLYDFGFAADEILITTFTKRKGSAPGKTKKQTADREKLFEYLRTGGPLADAPVVEHFTLTAEQAQSISVAQPPLYPHESLFADVPVFGDGFIAVRLPITDDPKIRRFASFHLSGFREFAGNLETLFGISGLGEDVEIPLTDTLKEAKCHYSEEKIEFLERVDYYEADPTLELKLVGRKCQACGLIISEDSRKKEKIGGVNGKAIAKAKCPKCQQKFGTESLFQLEAPPPVEEETPEEQAATAS